MPDIVPAGLPVPLVAAGAGWSALGAAIIEVKAALDVAVSEAKGTWTGEAADAFTEWWESRSAPMLELGAACEAVAATMLAAVGETTAANATWAVAAAMAAPLAPAIPAAGIVAWEGGLPAIEALITAAVAPVIANPYTTAQGAAIEVECTAAAATVFTLVTTSIGTSAAAVTAAGALATATVGAMVFGVGGDVPQGSEMDTMLNVGLPMAMGAGGAAWGAATGLKALKGAESVSKVAGDAPVAFKGRTKQLDNSVSDGSKASQALDAGDTESVLDDARTQSQQARRQSDAGDTESVLDDARTQSQQARRQHDAGDTESVLDDARTPSQQARRQHDAGDTESVLDDARTPSQQARRQSDAGDTESVLDDARTPSQQARRQHDAGDTQSVLDDAHTQSQRASEAADAGTDVRSRGLVDDLLIGAGVAGAGVLARKAARKRLTDVGLGGKAGENFIGKDASILGKAGLRGPLGKLKFSVSESKSAAQIRKNQFFLGGEQLKAIKELSVTKAGCDALHRRGFWTDAEVDKFVENPRWDQWEKISPQKRLQLANRAVLEPEKLKNTPAEMMALSIKAKTDPAAKARIYEHDAKQWSAAMEYHPRLADQAARAGVLKRIFGVLQSGELKYSDEAGGALKRWENHVPVAAALSHGGRVEIRIPALAKSEDDPDAFFKHIFGADNGKTAGLFTRTMGTHYVEIGPNTPLVQGKFKERLGNGAALKSGLDPNWKHYGLDVPVGGVGHMDGAGGRIDADGRHGHLYIGYKPPSQGRDGALLIGAETESPGKTNALGNVHDIRAKSAEMGPTGTHKSDRIGANDNGRIVDLNQLKRKDPDWLERLKSDAIRLQPDQLAGPPRKVPPPKPPRPGR